MSFSENKYIVIRDVIPKDMLELLRIQSQMLEDVMCHTYKTKPHLFFFGDTQSPKSFSHYSPLFSESLLVLLTPAIEKHLNCKLFPAYSYMRIYYKDATLEKHTDRPSCEYSATVCIKCNELEPWEIKFEDTNKKEICVKLNEGDMVIYKGDEIVHWRDPCNYDKHIQFFLNYVNANGKYSEFKYDKRIALGLRKDT